MRIKSLAAAVGLSVVAAVTLGQGVSSANRGSSDPVTEPAIEQPAEPVEEAPAPAPEVTPAEEEIPAPPVVEEPPAPVTTTTTRPPAPAPKPVRVPVADVEPAPVVTIEKKKADPAPAPTKPEAAPKQADPCHMDSYEPRDVEELNGDERARADKVDRNENGVVCRKDIPGKGRGNTGQNSNIKDDQVR
jgi:hypothetical protein